jgi:hypothetical protein
LAFTAGVAKFKLAKGVSLVHASSMALDGCLLNIIHQCSPTVMGGSMGILRE